MGGRLWELWSVLASASETAGGNKESSLEEVVFELFSKVKEIWLIEMAPELVGMYISREEDVVKDKTGKVSRHHPSYRGRLNLIQ